MGLNAKIWNQLVRYLKKQTNHVTVWSDFTPFAETVLEFAEPLRQINPRLHLLRQEETPWDAAFELYSSLAFLKLASNEENE
jgi:hypothetical protein